MKSCSNYLSSLISTCRRACLPSCLCVFSAVLLLCSCEPSQPVRRPVPAANEPAAVNPQAYAHFFAALDYEMKEDWEQAVVQLKKAEALDPYAATIQRHLATCYSMLRREEDAVIHLEKLSHGDPSDFRLSMQLGIHYNKEGQHKEAIAAFERVLAAPPSNEKTVLVPRTLMVLGQLYAKVRDFKKALDKYETLLQLQEAPEEEAAVRLAMARCYRKMKRRQEALEQCNKVLLLQPDSPLAYATMGGVYEDSGDYDAAIEWYERFVNGGGKSPHVFTALAEIYAREDKPAWQLHTLARAFEEGFGSTDTYRKLLQLCDDSEKPAELAENFRMVSDEGIERFVHQFALGMLYWSAENIEAADEAFETCRKSNPRFIPAYTDHASLHVEAKNYDRAIEILDEAINADLKFSLIYGVLSEVHRLAGNKEKALESARTALATAETDEAILTSRALLAIALSGAGLRSEAKEQLRESLRKKPDDPMLCNYLGYMYAEDGEHLEEAETLINIALDKDPTNGAYLDSLAWVYYRQDRFREALQYLKKALKDDSVARDPVILDHLGDVYYALGMLDKAEGTWSEALSSETESPDSGFDPDGVSEKLEGLRMLIEQREQ